MTLPSCLLIQSYDIYDSPSRKYSMFNYFLICCCVVSRVEKKYWSCASKNFLHAGSESFVLKLYEIIKKHND